MATATQEKAAKNGSVENPTPQKRITSQVLEQVQKLEQQGNLVLPADYAVQNALQAAWLALHEVKDKDNRLIMVNGSLTSVVSLVSVANALHDYVVQGLNVAKKQCYFIVFGDKLICQRSYFGDMALAKRVRPGIDFYYDVIREGDVFTQSKVRSRTQGLISCVGKHEQAFPQSGKILGAYVGVVDTETGEDLGIEVMDIDRIKKSWAMSKTYRADGNGTHNKFEAEMCLRTVIRHRCKSIFNSSDDSLLLQAVQRQDDDSMEAQVKEEVSLLANAEVLSLPAAAVTVDPIQAPEPVAAAEPVASAPAQQQLSEDAPF